MIHPGPYLCMMCGREPEVWDDDGLFVEPPFEVDDGKGGTTKDEAWIYCVDCDCWTAFAPVPDDSDDSDDTTLHSDGMHGDPHP